jgi:hypothetical protein
LMMASTVAGEAPARLTLTDLLKHDETLGLPAAPERSVATVSRSSLSAEELAERERVKAARAERREKDRAEAAARREQAAAGRVRYRG